jgi:hypothetical protein
VDPKHYPILHRAVPSLSIGKGQWDLDQEQSFTVEDAGFGVRGRRVVGEVSTVIHELGAVLVW